jgi:hypothetical protein
MRDLALLREKLQNQVVGGVSRNHVVDVDRIYLANSMGTVLRLDKHRGYEVELSEYQSRRCRQSDSYTACSDAQQCRLYVGLCLEGVH